MKIILASQSLGRKNLLKHLGLTFEVIPSHLEEEKILSDTPLNTLKLRARLKGENVANRIQNSEFRIQKPLTHSTSTEFIPSAVEELSASPQPATILSADSGAIIDHQLIGKPKDLNDAVRIMKILSGKTHEFVTAVFMKEFSSTIKAGDAKEGSPNEASPALSPTKWSDFEAKFGTLSRQDPQIKIWQSYETSLVTFRKLSEEDIRSYLSRTEYTRFAGGYAIGSGQDFITNIRGSISNVIGLPLEKIIPYFRKYKFL